ncbi:MAG TPA: biopolymer transporter ExbD [Candidatus Hydrogenedentes bacterium]|nr:biopolymer transporter ExbD [Candidatus Hydrogenedentota bacterium]HNT88881.1 biopolymer transporter ExbD [Candidatus Hydrogenedentota bacterium]
MRLTNDKKLRVSAQLDLTPLIDCVFQLIIFFMLSSTFVVQTSIQVELPEAEGARELENKDIAITLAHPGLDDNGKPRIEGLEGLGRVYVNEIEITSWPELTAVLGELYTRQPEALVLIRPDAQVPTARLVKVLGIANSVGISRYGIAARPPEEEE